MEVLVTFARAAIDRIKVSTYTVPTDFPESDGTLRWNSTTLVLVHAYAGNKVGLGYTYADTATAILIRDMLSKTVAGQNAMAPAASWNAMVSGTRNLGRPGIVSMAISAVDIAHMPGMFERRRQGFVAAAGHLLTPWPHPASPAAA